MTNILFERRTVIRAGGVALTGGLAGCTGNGGDGGGGAAEQSDITLQDTSFRPVRTAVEAGTTVTWTNNDSIGHDVTATQFTDAAAEWSFENSVGAGESVSHTFEESGQYEYYCTIHGESAMCGVVLVGEGSVEGSLPCEDSDDSGGGISY